MRQAFRRALLAGAVLAAALPGANPLPAQDASRAERLYRAGRFREALEAFRSLEERGAARSVFALEYNSGNALYRLARFEDAARSFRQAVAGPTELRQRSAYNLGNALVRAADDPLRRRRSLREAVAVYEQALLLDARDADAKWNLELALRKLEEDERWQSFPMRREGPGASAANEENEEGAQTAGLASPGRGGGAVSGSGTGPERLEPVPELTETEARQVLRSARREEARLVEQAARRGGPGKKDW